MTVIITVGWLLSLLSFQLRYHISPKSLPKNESITVNDSTIYVFEDKRGELLNFSWYTCQNGDLIGYRQPVEEYEHAKLEDDACNSDEALSIDGFRITRRSHQIIVFDNFKPDYDEYVWSLGYNHENAAMFLRYDSLPLRSYAGLDDSYSFLMNSRAHFVAFDAFVFLPPSSFQFHRHISSKLSYCESFRSLLNESPSYMFESHQFHYHGLMRSHIRSYCSLDPPIILSWPLHAHHLQRVANDTGGSLCTIHSIRNMVRSTKNYRCIDDVVKDELAADGRVLRFIYSSNELLSLMIHESINSTEARAASHQDFLALIQVLRAAPPLLSVSSIAQHQSFNQLSSPISVDEVGQGLQLAVVELFFDVLEDNTWDDKVEDLKHALKAQILISIESAVTSLIEAFTSMGKVKESCSDEHSLVSLDWCPRRLQLVNAVSDVLKKGASPEHTALKYWNVHSSRLFSMKASMTRGRVEKQPRPSVSVSSGGDVFVLIFVLPSQLHAAQLAVKYWDENCGLERVCQVCVKYLIFEVFPDAIDSSEANPECWRTQRTWSMNDRWDTLLEACPLPSHRSVLHITHEIIRLYTSANDIVVILNGLSAMQSFPQPGVESPRSLLPPVKYGMQDSYRLPSHIVVGLDSFSRPSFRSIAGVSLQLSKLIQEIRRHDSFPLSRDEQVVEIFEQVLGLNDEWVSYDSNCQVFCYDDRARISIQEMEASLIGKQNAFNSSLQTAVSWDNEDSKLSREEASEFYRTLAELRSIASDFNDGDDATMADFHRVVLPVLGPVTVLLSKVMTRLHFALAARYSILLAQLFFTHSWFSIFSGNLTIRFVEIGRFSHTLLG